MGKIVSINISSGKGTAKQAVEQAEVRPDHGIVGDAHAGNWHRQISLLAIESIHRMIDKGLDLRPGSFAENITTEGLDLANLNIGTRIISGNVEMEITQKGKKCHTTCNIYHTIGDCIMPREGVFAKIITPGILCREADISVKEAWDRR